jgi:hypothetical protein
MSALVSMACAGRTSLGSISAAAAMPLALFADRDFVRAVFRVMGVSLYGRALRIELYHSKRSV